MRNKFLSGILGLLSATLAIAAMIALTVFTFNYNTDGESNEGFVLFIIVIIIFPVMVLDGIFSLFIVGLSVTSLVLAGRNRVNKKVLTSVATIEIIAGAFMLLAAILILTFIIYAVLFFVSSIVCILSAILTLVSKSKLTQQPATQIENV